jgi:hypothetical protein
VARDDAGTTRQNKRQGLSISQTLDFWEFINQSFSSLMTTSRFAIWSLCYWSTRGFSCFPPPTVTKAWNCGAITREP